LNDYSFFSAPQLKRDPLGVTAQAEPSQRTPTMRLLLAVLAVLATITPLPALISAQTPPVVASLDTCRLQGGQTLLECRVAYRTFGTLNQRRDNVVLIPTWFTGRSADWPPFLGPTGLVDTTRFYVVVVDALGNGVSSSPSNSPAQPHPQFPAITIRDMVETQYRLLTERLRIPRLHAVLGISMGGMQAFEWGVAHPEFVERIVSIVGSPRLAAYDRVLWMAALSTIENGRRHGMPDDTVFAQLARIVRLVGSTPARVNEIEPSQIAAWLDTAARRMAASVNLDDYASQLRAMLSHDVSASTSGDLDRAAAAVRARVLVVYSPDDHVVTPQPGADFARRLRADTLAVPSPCGHAIFSCELRMVGEAVRAFLTR
jgi:homoserine O-acetyltransferase